MAQDRMAMHVVKPRKMKWSTGMAIAAGLSVALIGWAWIDGGREPLREIVQPVAVPEGAR